MQTYSTNHYAGTFDETEVTHARQFGGKRGKQAKSLESCLQGSKARRVPPACNGYLDGKSSQIVIIRR